MFKQDYQAAFSKVTASQETYRRVMRMAKTKKTRHSRGMAGKLLLAAIIVSMLAVTASAADFSWFTKFFGGPAELNQQQVQYLEENTQKLNAEEKNLENGIHMEGLQFVKQGEEVIIQADANNSHITGEGKTNYLDIRIWSLVLKETSARLCYYTMPGSDAMKPFSISHITVVLENGEEITMPISISVSAMDFVSEKTIPLEEVVSVRLPDGNEMKPVNEVEDGYSICVDSVLTDGQTMYITLDVTTPEEIESPGPGWTLDNNIHLLDTWICPTDQEKPTMEEMVLWYSGTKILEDGDGRENTYKLMLKMIRNGTEPLLSLGTNWKLHIDGLEAVWRNYENENALYDGKYAGQDVMLDEDEVAMTIRYETLCFDTWDFFLDLTTEENKESDEVELVSDPIALSAYRQATLDELQENPENDRIGPFDVQLVSLRLSPLSYYLEYTAEDSYDAQAADIGECILFLKDGSQIELYQYRGRHNFTKPIILSEADYVLLPNGTKLTIP